MYETIEKVNIKLEMGDRLQELIDKKMLKTLSESEELEFNKIYSSDVDFKTRYEEELEIAESIVYFSRKELYGELEELENSSSKTVFKISWRKMIPIAASLFFFIGLIWFLNSDDIQDDLSLVQTKSDSLKLTPNIAEKRKDIPETTITDSIDLIEKDEKIAKKVQSVEKQNTISLPVLVKGDLIIVKRKVNEGFGYNSNKEEKNKFNIAYDISPIKYKFNNQTLELQGKVDTNAKFRIEIIKSLEGNEYKLFIDKKSYLLDESDSFLELN